MLLKIDKDDGIAGKSGGISLDTGPCNSVPQTGAVALPTGFSPWRILPHRLLIGKCLPGRCQQLAHAETRPQGSGAVVCSTEKTIRGNTAQWGQTYHSKGSFGKPGDLLRTFTSSQ